MFKNLQYWLPGYILDRFSKALGSKATKCPIHIFVTICDHFEPTAEGVNRKKAFQRVKIWVERYPEIAKKYRDSTGSMPKYTFFYPIEEYEQKEMELLAQLCHKGYGEVEIHLHHNNDTAGNLRKTLINFKKLLHSKFNLLSKDKETGEIRYGFIHGNWALDNSKLDRTHCGVNNEIGILQETGCYADFTYPSAPDETQTQKVNSIYYAIDDPASPKSHNWGTDAKAARKGKGLLLIQGPLMLNWKARKWKAFPHIENGDLNQDNPITSDRIKLWVKANIHMQGKPGWLFVKVHTHGCKGENIKSLLNRDLDFLFSHLEDNYNDGNRFLLHYISARELYNIIKAVENDYVVTDLDINEYKNYMLNYGS